MTNEKYFQPRADRKLALHQLAGWARVSRRFAVVYHLGTIRWETPFDGRGLSPSRRVDVHP